MKVVFFSESGIVCKVQRDFPNARNDIAWSIMMNADCVHMITHQQIIMIWV